MGLSLAGLQSAVQGAAATVANLVGQVVTALQFVSSQAAGSDAFKVLTNGARWHFGTGASDFASSDGTTVTFAGPVTVTGAGVATSLKATNFIWSTGTFSLGASGKDFALTTAPTVVAGAGATVPSANGTVAFTIGLGAAAQTGTITLPTAFAGWVVYMQDITTPASFIFRQTGGTTTTATFTCYSATTGLAINWTANDVIACIAMAY